MAIENYTENGEITYAKEYLPEHCDHSFVPLGDSQGLIDQCEKCGELRA